MFGKLVRDESGIAMGLAVIVILLVGVMGAGLLVFVRNDLQAVVEVNQGRKALATADAGVQAAEQQLRINANPRRYDGNEDLEDSDWSYYKSGTTITLEEDQATVKIQHLLPVPNDQPDLTKDSDYAPEVLPEGESEYPNGRSYFRIISRGEAGGAIRVVESIAQIRETGMPSAWYSTGTIDWNGNAFRVKNVSVFAREDVLNFRADNLTGCDVAYGDWVRNPWNSVPRDAGTQACTRSDGTPFTGVPAGVGTLGQITYKQNAGARPGTIDYSNYDGDGSGTVDYPDFVPNTWVGTETSQDQTDISFPFNPDPDDQVDLEVLRSIAAPEQNNSKLITAPLGGTINLDNYASNSSTVYYIEFVDSDGDYENASGLSDPGTVDYGGSTSQGTIVVVNGDFEMEGNTTYTGIVLLRDPVEDARKLEFTNKGNVTLNGFANVDGNIIVSGSAESDVPIVESNVEENITSGLSMRPGFHVVERWS